MCLIFVGRQNTGRFPIAAVIRRGRNHPKPHAGREHVRREDPAPIRQRLFVQPFVGGAHAAPIAGHMALDKRRRADLRLFHFCDFRIGNPGRREVWSWPQNRSTRSPHLSRSDVKSRRPGTYDRFDVGAFCGCRRCSLHECDAGDFGFQSCA